MKHIYEYIDYRCFLREYYFEQKRLHRYFSFRYFSNKAGINSSSFLKHVIDGKRNLTPSTVSKFAKALGLDAKETRFFNHLVLFSQASSSCEKQDHYAILRSIGGCVSEKVLSGTLFDYFEKWYISVLRELVCLYNFNDDWRTIARSIVPPISAVEARQGVDTLLKLNLIRKRTLGGYEQTHTAIVADDSIRSLALRSFTTSMIRHTEAALTTFSREERYICAITCGVSKAAYNALTVEIEAFKDRVKAIVNHDQASSRVYQLNLSLFPMSSDMSQSMEEGNLL